MEAGTISTIAQWAVTCLTGMGLIATWVRNGKKESKELGKLTEKVDNMKDSMDNGLRQVNCRLDDTNKNSVELQRSVNERVNQQEKRIDDVVLTIARSNGKREG